jgi:translation elongation factor EF-Tu-like GTPase
MSKVAKSIRRGLEQAVAYAKGHADEHEYRAHIPPRLLDIEAEITFLTTAEGGRQGPVRTGYRAAHDFGVNGTLNDALHEYIGKEWVPLGETVTARLWFLAAEFQIGRLYDGFEFTVQEGSKIVGRGRVTKILNEALRRPSSA